MKKIILSVAVAAMALSTTASALEDIKVNGQAKVWYETNDKGTNSLFGEDGSSAEVAYKLGMTGKQGNVSFEGEVSMGTTMGLEDVIVTGVRTDAVGSDLYASKMNVTVPLVANTALKLGRQELNTPLAFTEKWNTLQNNFDAAVLVNSSIANTTIIGAFVGQTNTADADTWKATNEFNQMHGGAYAVGALYNDKTVAVNAWFYNLKDYARTNDILGLGVDLGAGNYAAGLGAVDAFWVDAGMTMGGVNVKGYLAQVAPQASTLDATLSYAASVSAKVSGWTVYGAFSMVGEGAVGPSNVATGGKKTKLPTAGVYTDGLYVAKPESTAVKVKAAGKIGGTGLAVQFVNNTNDLDNTLDTTEIDVIVTRKVGDINLKGLVMQRTLDNDAAAEGLYVRVIAGINF